MACPSRREYPLTLSNRSPAEFSYDLQLFGIGQALIAEEAGYVRIEKSFRDRKPLTRVRLTPSCRKAFAEYLDTMAKLVDAAARPR